MIGGSAARGDAIMFRKDLITLLLGNPMGVSQIAREVQEPPSQVADDLQHLLRSLKHSDYRPAIEPARCRACGFEFSEAKLTNPSKCPECHSTWVLEPKIGIQSKTQGEPPSK
jgi:predicted Zn-ribbon and HTH transcriptional regulator